jgi:hypothetical protein
MISDSFSGTGDPFQVNFNSILPPLMKISWSKMIGVYSIQISEPDAVCASS